MMISLQARATRGTALVPSQGGKNNPRSLNNNFFLKYQGQHVLRGKYVYHTHNKNFFNFMTTQEQALLLLCLTGKGTD